MARSIPPAQLGLLERRCLACRELKPTTEFVSHRGTGFTTWCRPCLERGRSPRTRSALGLGARPRTEDLSKVRRLPVVGYPSDIPRPKTRGDCADGPRPCPWVSCRHHLYLEARGLSLKLLFPDRDPDEIGETCALDVADRGGVTEREVAMLTNQTHQRVQQIEVSAMRRLHGSTLEEFREEGAELAEQRRYNYGAGQIARGGNEGCSSLEEEDAPPREETGMVRFADEGGDDAWLARVWRAYLAGAPR